MAVFEHSGSFNIAAETTLLVCGEQSERYPSVKYETWVLLAIYDGLRASLHAIKQYFLI